MKKKNSTTEKIETIKLFSKNLAVRTYKLINRIEEDNYSLIECMDEVSCTIFILKIESELFPDNIEKIKNIIDSDDILKRYIITNNNDTFKYYFPYLMEYIPSRFLNNLGWEILFSTPENITLKIFELADYEFEQIV